MVQAVLTRALRATSRPFARPDVWYRQGSWDDCGAPEDD